MPSQFGQGWANWAVNEYKVLAASGVIDVSQWLVSTETAQNRKKAPSTAAGIAWAVSFLSFGAERLKQPFWGHTATHSRHPIHSGLRTVRLSEMGMDAGQVLSHCLQSTHSATSLFTCKGAQESQQAQQRPVRAYASAPEVAQDQRDEQKKCHDVDHEGGWREKKKQHFSIHNLIVGPVNKGLYRPEVHLPKDDMDKKSQ